MKILRDDYGGLYIFKLPFKTKGVFLKIGKSLSKKNLRLDILPDSWTAEL